MLENQFHASTIGIEFSLLLRVFAAVASHWQKAEEEWQRNRIRYSDIILQLHPIKSFFLYRSNQMPRKCVKMSFERTRALMVTKVAATVVAHLSIKMLNRISPRERERAESLENCCQTTDSRISLTQTTNEHKFEIHFDLEILSSQFTWMALDLRSKTTHCIQVVVDYSIEQKMLVFIVVSFDYRSNVYINLKGGTNTWTDIQQSLVIAIEFTVRPHERLILFTN